MRRGVLFWRFWRVGWRFAEFQFSRFFWGGREGVGVLLWIFGVFFLEGRRGGGSLEGGGSVCFCFFFGEAGEWRERGWEEAGLGVLFFAGGRGRVSAQRHNNSVSFFSAFQSSESWSASRRHQLSLSSLCRTNSNGDGCGSYRSQVFSLRSQRCSSNVMTLTAAVDLVTAFVEQCHRFANASALTQGPQEKKCTHLTIHTHDSSHRRRGGGRRGRVVVGGEGAKGKGILSGIGFFGCRVWGSSLMHERMVLTTAHTRVDQVSKATRHLNKDPRKME